MLATAVVLEDDVGVGVVVDEEGKGVLLVLATAVVLEDDVGVCVVVVVAAMQPAHAMKRTSQTCKTEQSARGLMAKKGGSRLAPVRWSLQALTSYCQQLRPGYKRRAAPLQVKCSQFFSSAY